MQLVLRREPGLERNLGPWLGFKTTIPGESSQGLCRQDRKGNPESPVAMDV